MNREADRFANEILTLSRNKLLVNLRFLDVALSYHNRVAYEGSLATDGKALFYDPWFVLQSYKKSQEETVRMYLHIILHCVFHHPYIGISIDERLWNLACDIAVEHTVNDLGLGGVYSARETRQKLFVSELQKEIQLLTAEKIYAVLKKGDYPDRVLQQWEEVFHCDDHIPWYQWTRNAAFIKTPDASHDTSETAGTRIQDMAFWERTSRQIQMDLEAFSKQRGDIAGSMMQNLRSVNREKYDYTVFLKKFAVLGEVMKVNEDEYDYIYYTYAVYYDLFRKYRGDYQVDRILEGKADELIKSRAQKAGFDERLSLLGLLLDRINEEVRSIIGDEEYLCSCLECLKRFRQRMAAGMNIPQNEMEKIVSQEKKDLEAAQNSGALSQNDRICRQKTIRFLQELALKLEGEESADKAFKLVKKKYNASVKDLTKKADAVKRRLSNLFLFCEEVFGEGQEMLIVVTELTANYNSVRFISEFGCDEYFRHNKELLFYERQKEIISRMEELGL